MERDSRSGGEGKGSLEELMRERIRGSIELIVEQELRKPWARRVQSGSGINALGIGTATAVAR